MLVGYVTVCEAINITFEVCCSHYGFVPSYVNFEFIITKYMNTIIDFTFCRLLIQLTNKHEQSGESKPTLGYCVYR